MRINDGPVTGIKRKKTKAVREHPLQSNGVFNARAGMLNLLRSDGLPPSTSFCFVFHDLRPLLSEATREPGDYGGTGMSVNLL